MDTIEINNCVNVSDIFNNKTWIHGKSTENIKITLFLITICTDQLRHSLHAINNLPEDIPVIVNIIMNISPTNAAYNEMRLRCTTDFFAQIDEDMELNVDALLLFYKYMNTTNNTFLHTFKLVDTVLGIGNPPVIDCLKLYDNRVMKKYPTYDDGKISISSVDQLWHKPIILAGYTVKDTHIVIGCHGKHRSNFDLFLRYCKITSSMIDTRIKTNSGHLCKLLRGLDTININKILGITKLHFNIFYKVDDYQLNNMINHINAYVPPANISMYKIINRTPLHNASEKFTTEKFIDTLNHPFCTDKEYILCIVAILCVTTGNYEYSFDKYPRNIFDYFDKLTNNTLDTMIYGEKTDSIKYIENKLCYV
jgi:hypothetical protein